MKKKAILGTVCSSLIVSSTACTGIRESAEIISSESILIHAHIDDAAQTGDSRTVLGANGLTVNWKEGDTLQFIGRNGEDFVYARLPLIQGAGTPDGVFHMDRQYADCSLPAFLYPAPKDFAYAQKHYDDEYVVKLFLDPMQKSHASGDIGGYDFKTGTSFSKIGDDDCKVNFKQRLVLLDFLVHPTHEMIADGEKLKNLSLTVSFSIAGYFFMYLYDDKSPYPDPEGGIKAVSVSPDAPMALSADAPCELRMFVLPSIFEGDNLKISLKTENYTATVNAKASKRYVSGYRYTMTLNLPELVSAGKATVVKEEPFLRNDRDFGIFDISNPASPRPELTVDENWQCGEDVSSGIFRMVNWQDKKILWIRHPCNMSQGESVDLEISSYGNTGHTDGTVEAVVAKIEDGVCWLKDKEGKGYIIKTAIQ